MPFNSVTYLLFLPVVYAAFYLVGDRVRWTVLLAASLLFYAALNVPYLVAVLILVAISTYGFGIWLDQTPSEKKKRILLSIGISTNVLILVVMKYLPFIFQNLEIFSALFSLNTHIQPFKGFITIGLSYYIFQSISYLFDIYLEKEKAESHFGYFALYLAFFPKLFQGPIERGSDLIPQLKKKFVFDYDNMRLGMLLFTWGLFKKVVIADRLALYVDTIYNDVHSFVGLPLLLSTYAYAFQIYMDFSGYTDMALGSALLFNIKLTQNFNNPYLATSVADFWRRWHISFSSWILDYIFKPLQMQWRNWKNWGTPAALVVAFLISGIWHGASWGFVIWGGLHGLYMACSVLYVPYQKKLYKTFQIEKSIWLKWWKVFITFNLISFAWIFFRANSISDSLYIVSNLCNDLPNQISSFLAHGFSTSSLRLGKLIPWKTMSDVVMFSMMLLLFFIGKHANLKVTSIIKKPLLFRWGVYYFLIMAILIFGVAAKQKFIYMKF